MIVCILSLRDLSMNIYVGNLAFAATDDDLRQPFAPMERWA